MGANNFTVEDAAKETDTSTSKVSEAWHDARDDAAEEGGWGVPEDRHGSDDKQSSSSSDSESSSSTESDSGSDNSGK